MEKLYFIALIPPGEICDEIMNFKQDIADHFESKKALKVVPHITLKAPFKLDSSDQDQLLAWFQKIYLSQGSFKLELKNFGHFYHKKNPVIYVHPVMNVPLFSLQKEIIRSFRDHFPELVQPMDLKFKPHMTIAYRDLSLDQFTKAWEIYQTKEYHALFDVNSFYLLQHDGKSWQVLETYHLDF